MESCVPLPAGALLVVGDLHVEAKNKIPVGQLLAELIGVLAELQGGVAAVVLLGDVLCHHELVHTRDLLLAVDFMRVLAAAGPHVFVIVGNHDEATPEVYDHPLARGTGGSGGGGTWLAALAGHAGITVVDRGTRAQTACGLRILLAPYVPKGLLTTELATAGPLDAADVVFAHQEMRGAQLGHVSSVDGDVWPLDRPLLVSGHVHDNQWVAPNMYYPGVPYGLAFRKKARTLIALVGNPICDGWRRVSTGRVPVWERLIRTVEKRIAMHASLGAGEAEAAAHRAMQHAVHGNAIVLIVHGVKEDFARFQASEGYKDLVDRGVRVQHRHVPRAKAPLAKQAAVVDENFFLGYLKGAVAEIADPRVSRVHALIVQGL